MGNDTVVRVAALNSGEHKNGTAGAPGVTLTCIRVEHYVCPGLVPGRVFL